MRNNNSITSVYATLRDSSERGHKRAADAAYGRAKQLLMCERTYKRDLQLVTVGWSVRVSALAASAPALLEPLGRPCLALEPLALAQGAFLARLERCLAHVPRDDNEEPEYKRIAEYLYEYLSTTCEAYSEYIAQAGALAARVESARRGAAAAAALAADLEAHSPLPLGALLLRPLRRLRDYVRLADELSDAPADSAAGRAAAQAAALARALAERARLELQHAENHAELCRLQRGLLGYDKLLVAEREFLRLGCVYKHSAKGLQQRMLFLFSDILVVSSKSASGAQFRAHAVLPLRALAVRDSDMAHSLELVHDDTTTVISTTTAAEHGAWRAALAAAARRARDAPPPPAPPDTQLTPYAQETGGGGGGAAAGAALALVCWHRVTSLSREHLHLAMMSQLSGYLLRKFKNSAGWQRLWVQYAALALHFYKTWQDDAPLAALPLRGYTVGPPGGGDGVQKEFVFKLQYKSHVYYFRADNLYSYNRWIEALQTASACAESPDDE